MASITDVARLAGVSTATVSRVVSSAPYAVSPATRARVLDAARTLDYVPNALARGLLKSYIPVVGVVVHDITDPYFSEVVRGRRGRGDARRLPGHHLQLGPHRRARELVRPAAALDARGDAHLRRQRAGRPGGQRRDAQARRRDARLRRGRRPPLAARLRRGGGRRRQRRRHRRRWSPSSSGSATGRSRSWPGRPSLYVARQRLAGYRRGLAEAGIAFDERLVVSTGFNREGGALGIDTLLAGSTPVHRGLRGQRPARARRAASGWRRSASRSRARSRSRASTTSRPRRWPRRGCRPSGCRCTRSVVAASRSRSGCSPGAAPRREVLPTELVMRDSTAPPPASALPRAPRPDRRAAVAA